MSNLYTCTDCKLDYALSAERIEAEAPKHDSFMCDICADEGEEGGYMKEKESCYGCDYFYPVGELDRVIMQGYETNLCRDCIKKI